MRQTALTAARKASKLLMQYFDKDIPGVRNKDGKSLVTDVDQESERLIIREIRKKFPDHNIVTEESPAQMKGSDWTWYIDPIDGTHNFIKGIPLFGVSIAYAHKGKMEYGVIILPAFKKTYVAERGKGAACNGRPVQVSDKAGMDFSTILLDSSLHGRKGSLAFLKKNSAGLFSERMTGCAVYSAALLAEGKAAGWLIYKTHPWDIAAGFLLIEEAGGRVTDQKGKPWSIEEESFCASNGLLHRALLKAL